ncbi:MFS transporter [Limibaculum sp. FT325]|uniref:MFS transporter n=1 Tax=Thermohalobaculum sediminis TaxID=2939436 RepID=UPI0020BDE5ED|nr:MFS transporter [Limibaculum sediminis]MCL5776973.1 MFS transporter [Limibaculum sediminis]
MPASAAAPPALPDSARSWRRLALSFLMAAIGGVGLWSTVVVLPTIQAEFGVDRGGASLPFTATLIGFAAGGVVMGRVADRFGIAVPLGLGAVMLGAGYVAAGLSQSYWQFLLAQALLIGMLGSSPSFGPLVADVSHWFRRRRGIAVAIAASGSYAAGAIWPPVIQWATEAWGWRAAHMGVGLFCLVTLLPLSLMMRERPVLDDTPLPARRASGGTRRSVMAPGRLQALLALAGVACCVAMSMPQVHLVAYCVDLGYGPAVGAEMLSMMLGLGIASRLASGFIADRIGGLGTLILGSALQAVALVFFLPFDGLVSLYLVAALFGLSQGGIVPSYALIVRDHFPAREAGSRVSIVLMSTVLGMALGGWMSGEIHDLTGSYAAAFLNGIAWNLLNLGIALWLMMAGRGGASARPQPVAV